MKTILVLGGYGATGKCLARHLLEQTDTRLRLAGRHIESARLFTSELNQLFPGGRVEAVYVDAADVSSLQLALEGVDILINAAPTTRYTRRVVAEAINVRADYIDIQIGAEKLAVLRSRADEMKNAGLCFITEAGFHPGLPSAMVRMAGQSFDEMRSAITAGYLNIGPEPKYTEAVDELMEEFNHYQAQVFHEGAWTKPGDWQSRKVDFGNPVGIRTCSSMYFEELAALPSLFPSLHETGFYIAGSHWFTDWVIFPIALAGMKIAPKRGIRPLGKMVWWGMTKLPRPPYTVMLKVEAEGKKDGRKTRVEIAVSHEDGYELTAIPVVAMLKQVLDGSARKPGLWLMGHLAEPGRLFRDMQQMGVAVNKVETEILAEQK